MSIREATVLRPIRIVLAVLSIGEVLALPLLFVHIGALAVGSAEWSTVAAPGQSPSSRFAPLTMSTVTLAFRTTDVPAHLAYGLVHGGAFVLGTIPMLICAYWVTGAALAGDAFTSQMVLRLRLLAGLVLLGGFGTEMLEVVGSVYLLDYVGLSELALGDSVTPLYHLDWWWIPIGLVVFAVAAAVDHGVAMRRELDGVV
jgi:hypothetical protein